MNFDTPLISGRIVKRYKRFLADIILSEDHGEHKKGESITVHTPNTGSMKSCWEKNWPALISFHDNPKRKLKYTLEMTHNGESWIGLHTGRPNRLVYEAIKQRQIPELDKYQNIKPEIKVGKSRIDLLLYNGDFKQPTNQCFVEIKNVTLRENSKALFPDAVTERGQKHLRELIELKKSGIESCIFFVVQRTDVSEFSPAKEIDPVYSKLLSMCIDEGVIALAYQFEANQDGIRISKRLPIILD